MSAVVRLPTGKALSVRAAADMFLDSLGNPKRSGTTGSGWAVPHHLEAFDLWRGDLTGVGADLLGGGVEDDLRWRAEAGTASLLDLRSAVNAMLHWNVAT